MKIQKWTIGVVLFLFICNANSASLWLEPSSQNIDQDTSFSMDLWMDFSEEPTIGGGVVLSFDSALVAFQGYNWNSVFPNDDALSGWSVTAPSVVEVGFGNFGGISGPALVGSFDFSSLLADGIAQFALASGGLYGPFISATTYNQYPAAAVMLTDTSVNISSVPLPAAAWLFIYGLGVIGFAKRKK